MKTILIASFSLLSAVCAETADQIARRSIREGVFYPAFDPSPYGRRKETLADADSSFAQYMASDEVPERIRIAYALRELRYRVGATVTKLMDGKLEVDESKTEEMRKRLWAEIHTLEDRMVVLQEPANPQKKRAEHDAP